MERLQILHSTSRTRIHHDPPGLRHRWRDLLRRRLDQLRPRVIRWRARFSRSSRCYTPFSFLGIPFSPFSRKLRTFAEETDNNVWMQLGMLLWSYFSVVFTDPGVVPPNWRPASDEEEQEGECDPLNSLEFGGLQPDASNQRTRFCRKCNQHKPPRCHHCSVCKLSLWSHFLFYAPLLQLRKVIVCLNSGGRCVLKMDHHCVWVVNCVGALNYKYFLLFLVSLGPRS